VFSVNRLVLTEDSLKLSNVMLHLLSVKNSLCWWELQWTSHDQIRLLLCDTGMQDNTMAHFLLKLHHNVNIPVWCIWCMLSATRNIGTVFHSGTVCRAHTASGSVTSTIK